MRDAGHQAAERGELVGTREVRLGGEERLVGARQILRALHHPLLERRTQLAHRRIGGRVSERDGRLVAERPEQPEIVRAVGRARSFRSDGEQTFEAVLDAQRDDQLDAGCGEHARAAARARGERHDRSARPGDGAEHRIVRRDSDTAPVAQHPVAVREEEETGNRRHRLLQRPGDGRDDLAPVERRGERPADRLDGRLRIVPRPEEDAVDQALHGAPDGGEDRDHDEREEEGRPRRRAGHLARPEGVRDAEQRDVPHRHGHAEHDVEDAPREQRVEVEEVVLQDRVGERQRQQRGGDRQEIHRQRHARRRRRELHARRRADRDQAAECHDLHPHPVLGRGAAIPGDDQRAGTKRHRREVDEAPVEEAHPELGRAVVEPDVEARVQTGDGGERDEQRARAARQRPVGKGECQDEQRRRRHRLRARVQRPEVEPVEVAERHHHHETPGRAEDEHRRARRPAGLQVGDHEAEDEKHRAVDKQNAET